MLNLSTAAEPIRSVLLIDYENVGGLVPIRKMAGWLAWLEDGQFDPEGRPRQFVERRVYDTKFQDHLHTPEIEAQISFVTCPRPFATAKNVVDMALILDAHELALRDSSLTEFVILSMDRDYVPLLLRLRQMGRRTVALAHPISPGIEVYQELVDLVLTGSRPETWCRRQGGGVRRREAVGRPERNAA